MGKTVNEIENHIEHKREDLKSNLQELENRVKSAVDWRHYFQNHAGTMIAAAFGGGLLLSTMVGKRKRSSNMAPAPQDTADSGAKHQVLKAWDTITSALVGVAATKFTGMLSDVVPGFTEHLAKAEGDKGLNPGNGASAEMNHGRISGVPQRGP